MILCSRVVECLVRVKKGEGWGVFFSQFFARPSRLAAAIEKRESMKRAILRDDDLHIAQTVGIITIA